MYDETLRMPFELSRIPLFTFAERQVKLWALWRKLLFSTAIVLGCRISVGWIVLS